MNCLRGSEDDQEDVCLTNGVRMCRGDFAGRRNILNKDTGVWQIALHLGFSSSWVWLGGEGVWGQIVEGLIHLAYPMGLGVWKRLTSSYD